MQDNAAVPEVVDCVRAGMGRGGTSRFRGVSWKSQSGKWVAQISAYGKHRNIGVFDDEIAAARAYDEAAREMHGEFARLNFPPNQDGIVPSKAANLTGEGTLGRHEARRLFGVCLKTWERWEREGTIRCGTFVQLPSGGRAKRYPIQEIERLLEEFGRLAPPYPDPARLGCYRVPLTGRDVRRREAIVDAETLPIVEGRSWCWCEGSSEGKGMVIQARRGEATPLRRIIMGVVDVPSDKVQVAHINGDALDCRRENLVLRTITQRLASARKRKTHRGKPCSSRFKGVCWDAQSERWKVQIRAHGKTRHVGFYHNEVDAAEAYDKAARELFGEHAWLNFPDDGPRAWPEEILQRAAA